MSALARGAQFLGSRSGQGFIIFLCVSQLFAAVIGYGFYASNLSWFKEHKSEEKVTALRLVDAFVNNYASQRAKLSTTSAPVPATFRADSIAAFNKSQGGSNEFNLMWVGVPDRAIKTGPLDDAMAETINGFIGKDKPLPVSTILSVNNQQVFRTVYPSFAKEQSCVDCHNQLQANGPTWHLGDLMGAFAIDVPMGPFLKSNLIETFGLAFAIFFSLGTMGLAFSLYHYKKAKQSEAAEATLAESEARFRDFAEATSDWFWEQDENLRFTRFSVGGRSTELTSQNDLGKTRHETVKLGVTDEQWIAHDAELAARLPFHNFRFQRAMPDGQIVYVSISGRPVFDIHGVFHGYRGAGRDVSGEIAVEVELQRRVEERTAELKSTQGELLRKERLSALGQLTATMAHELRNPLSAIRNTLFAVKETAAAAGISLERPVSRVERSVARCDRIINDLLDYTRMKELHCSIVAPDAWVEEVLNDQHFPPDLTVEHKLDADCLIKIDPERMRRVLINLLDNAAQAMAEGTERKITVTTALIGDGVELAVTDTGGGIPADVLPKVFEPLFSTKSFGTGLGLPMVKQIVEQHGGTITITSEAGKGTRVTLRLRKVAEEEVIAA
jgi:signal transduction histidine kinase